MEWLSSSALKSMPDRSSHIETHEANPTFACPYMAAISITGTTTMTTR